MDRSNFRIERNGNGIINGVEGTIYHVYELQRGDGYIHAGASVAPGFDRSDSECLDHWLSAEYDDA